MLINNQVSQMLGVINKSWRNKYHKWPPVCRWKWRYCKIQFWQNCKWQLFTSAAVFSLYWKQPL